MAINVPVLPVPVLKYKSVNHHIVFVSVPRN